MDNQYKTAPLDLDALEATAWAANQGDWWQPTEDQFNDIYDMDRCDFNLLAAASPAVVLELVRRLRGVEKLLSIIGAAYQIAGTHDCPEHVLDVLSDPEAATAEQVDALLPYSAPDLATIVSTARRLLAVLQCEDAAEELMYSGTSSDITADDRKPFELAQEDRHQVMKMLAIELAAIGGAK